MRKLGWVPVALGVLGFVLTLGNCGPLSSRTKPSHGGSAATGGEAQGGDETNVSGSAGKANGGTSSNIGGETTNGADASGGAIAEGGAPGEAGNAGAGGAGGEPEPAGPIEIATGQKSPTGIAIDKSFVYWANRDDGTIVKCPRSGCGGQAPTPVGMGTAPLGVTVDAKSLYWVEAVSGGIGRVFRCPIGGCAAAPTKLTEWSVGNRTNDVHVAGSTLYIAAWPMLGTCSTAGCMMPTNVSGGPYVSVDTDAEYLYTGRYGTTQLVRCPLAGCPSDFSMALTIAPNVYAIAVAVDANYVYFNDHDAFSGAAPTKHEIDKCPIAGCGMNAPEVVLSGDVFPYGLTVSSTRLYYTDITKGAVVSIPK